MTIYLLITRAVFTGQLLTFSVVGFGLTLWKSELSLLKTHALTGHPNQLPGDFVP